jgi:hypothetical protein
MKTTLLVSIATLACSAISFAAAQGETSSAQYQMYPKNLARQHLGSNLLQFDNASRMFKPTQAAAAWLDDDVTTGWPLMAEKSYYLVTLQRAELLTNFSLSTRSTSGTVSIYASDTAAAPGEATWEPLLKDASLETVNQKLSRPFSRVAKYVLIETESADPGPVYSVYLFSHKPAVSYEVQKRDRAVEPRSIFGPYVNEGTAFNSSSLYSHSLVTQASGSSDQTAWQQAIDDNPETFVQLAPSAETLTTVKYNGSRTVSRVALLTDAGTKGKVDIFLTGEGTAVTPDTAPTMTMVLDGSTARSSVDFPATQASSMSLRWTPDNANDTLALREVNSFGDATLSNQVVSATANTPAAIADQDPAAATRSNNDGKDLVDAKDPKDSKAMPEAVAAGPAPGPYLPGALGFPPGPGLGLVEPPALSN